MKRRQARLSRNECDCRKTVAPVRRRRLNRSLRETRLDSSSCNNPDCQFCEVRLYSGISKKQVNEIRGQLTYHQCGPREILFRAGDPSSDLFVIREGQVKLTRTDINGHEHLISLVGTGYYLGFDTIGNPLYSYSAETLAPTVFCRVKHSDMLRIIRQYPKVSLNVLLAVNEQLAQARSLIRVLGQKSATEKIAALLLSLLPPHFEGADDAPQALHLSRIEMAEILGITVETVSRNMAELRRKGIIDAPRGSIVIRARKRLRALAGVPLRAASSIDAGVRRAMKKSGPLYPFSYSRSRVTPSTATARITRRSGRLISIPRG